MSEVEIRPAVAADEVIAASHLFDEAARPEWTQRFLDEPGHHLLIAYVDDEAAGFVSGVELTHPDKGTEMFLYDSASMRATATGASGAGWSRRSASWRGGADAMACGCSPIATTPPRSGPIERAGRRGTATR